MRVPVNRVSGKSKPRQDSPEDAFAEVLAKKYTVVRDKHFTGNGNDFTASIALPQHSLIIEIQEKRNDKSIMAEMKREGIARATGWGIVSFPADDVRSDVDNILYKIAREIERRKR
jgi:very-short-patch-repair endonuclease